MHSSRMRTACSSSHLLEGVSASVHAGILLGVDLETPPPQVGLETPHPRCGPGDPPPGQTPQVPPGCGPGDPQGQTPQLPPPQVWAWRPARYAEIPPPPSSRDLQGMLGYHPRTEFLTHATENITLAKTSFAGGKKYEDTLFPWMGECNSVLVV